MSTGLRLSKLMPDGVLACASPVALHCPAAPATTSRPWGQGITCNTGYQQCDEVCIENFQKMASVAVTCCCAVLRAEGQSSVQMVVANSLHFQWLLLTENVFVDASACLAMVGKH